LAIVGNKMDLIDNDNDYTILENKGKELALKFNGTYYATSAKTGEGIQQVFVDVAKNIAKN
jgi:GTPase SAR1 family protein